MACGTGKHQLEGPQSAHSAWLEEQFIALVAHVRVIEIRSLERDAALNDKCAELRQQVKLLKHNIADSPPNPPSVEPNPRTAQGGSVLADALTSGDSAPGSPKKQGKEEGAARAAMQRLDMERALLGMTAPMQRQIDALEEDVVSYAKMATQLRSELRLDDQGMSIERMADRIVDVRCAHSCSCDKLLVHSGSCTFTRNFHLAYTLHSAPHLLISASVFEI